MCSLMRSPYGRTSEIIMLMPAIKELIGVQRVQTVRVESNVDMFKAKNSGKIR